MPKVPMRTVALPLDLYERVAVEAKRLRYNVRGFVAQVLIERLQLENDPQSQTQVAQDRAD